MIGIYSLYQDFNSLANTFQGGFWSPQQNFVAAVNDISRELLQEKFEQWQKAQKNTDDMYVFLETANIKVDLAKGLTYDVAVLPANFAHYSSARVIIQRTGSSVIGCGCNTGITGLPAKTYNGHDGSLMPCSTTDRYVDPDEVAMAESKSGDGLIEGVVRIISNQQWSFVVNSVTKRPKRDTPGITMYGGGMKIYPKNIGILILDYFRIPKPAVFNYTLGANDEIIYNATGSVDLEWPDTVKPEFMARLLKKYGIFTGQQDLYQMGELERQITK